MYSVFHLISTHTGFMNVDSFCGAFSFCKTQSFVASWCFLAHLQNSPSAAQKCKVSPPVSFFVLFKLTVFIIFLLPCTSRFHLQVRFPGSCASTASVQKFKTYATSSLNSLEIKSTATWQITVKANLLFYKLLKMTVNIKKSLPGHWRRKSDASIRRVDH